MFLTDTPPLFFLDHYTVGCLLLSLWQRLILLCLRCVPLWKTWKTAKCRKDNQLLIADFPDILVPRLATKRMIKAALYEALVNFQVLPVQEMHPLSVFWHSRYLCRTLSVVGECRPRVAKDWFFLPWLADCSKATKAETKVTGVSDSVAAHLWEKVGGGV